MDAIVKKLNQLKKQQGITLKQLSELSGLTLGTINKIMSGSLKKIKPEKLKSLAKALGVSVQYLTDSNDDTNSNKPNYGLLNVACISPEVVVADVKHNISEILKQSKKAYENGVKLALFPELCITGYTCEDLFFQNTLRKAALNGLKELCTLLTPLDIVVVVGLPICDNLDNLYNAAAVLYHGEILGIVPKTNLPNYNEFYEKRFFTPAPQETTSINVLGKNVPFGTKLIFQDIDFPELKFSIEICEDVWVAESPSISHAAAGANVILNLSASDETVAKADYRRKMIEIQSGKLCSAYLYASSGPSESTSSVVFSAHNIICENGDILAESLPFTSSYIQAQVDLEFISNERARMKRSEAYGYTTISFSLPVSTIPDRFYNPTPFVPHDKIQFNERCERVLTMLSYGLKKRIEHTKAAKLVIGVSGGSDSSLALLICTRALKLLNRPSTDIIAVTMPCFGTTERTLNNSIALAVALGTTVKKVDISKAVIQHFEDINHDFNKTNIVFENSQARERTQVLMDISNEVNGLVVGTGDLSELALGWATFNGDHMSMYGVNSSVPKTLVKALLKYTANNSSAEVKRVLTDIIDTPISPELLPSNDKKQITQVTEDVVGPYELHDYFLYMLIRKGFMPSKVYALAQISFADKYDKDTIYKWLKKFIWRFFSQQFKRSCTPDGVRLGSVDLSKYGHRMPSDASCESWLQDLEYAHKNF